MDRKKFLYVKKKQMLNKINIKMRIVKIKIKINYSTCYLNKNFQKNIFKQVQIRNLFYLKI